MQFSLAGVSLLVGLLIGELALRILVPQIGWHIEGDTSLGWSSREYKSFDPAGDVPVAGQTRILFLGDSNLAGSGVRVRDDRFPIVLGKLLGQDAVVRIIASGGWGTDQELLAFLQKGRTWEPDIVVLTFTPYNDLANILSNGTPPSQSKPYFAIDEDSGDLELFAADGTLIAPVAGDPDRLKLESHLLNLLRFQLSELRGPPSPEPEAAAPAGAVDERYLHYGRIRQSREAFLELVRPLRTGQREVDWSPQLGVNPVSAYIHEEFELNTYQWRLLERILDLLKRETDSIGARLIVLLLPIPFNPPDPRTIGGGEFEFEFSTPDGTFTFRAAEPRDRLGAICERTGIEFYDPSARFIETVMSDGRVEEFWPDPHDTHLSSAGHAVLAGMMRQYLEREAR